MMEKTDEEVKLSPEMIQSGADVLMNWRVADIGPYSARGLAGEIFCAMIKAKPPLDSY